MRRETPLIYGMLSLLQDNYERNLFKNNKAKYYN